MFWFLGFIWPIVIPEIPQTTLWKYLENTWKMKMKYCKPIPQVCRKVRNAKRLSGLCIYKYLYMNIVFCTLLMLMMYLMLHCLASTVSTCLLGNYPWQPCFACASNFNATRSIFIWFVDFVKITRLLFFSVHQVFMAKLYFSSK